MTTQEAFSILVQAVRSVQANADAHDKIREALIQVQKDLFPSKDEPRKAK